MNRKRLMSIIGASIVALMMNYSNIDAASKSAQVTASSLNVRSGAGTNNGIIGSLQNGLIVEVLGTQGDWTIINYNGVTGYVSSQYLTYVEPATPVQNPGDEYNDVNYEQVQTMYSNTESLNIRNEPSGIVIGTFGYGDKVEVVEQLDNGWSKIIYNNGYAYVSSSYLSYEVGQRPLPKPTDTPYIDDPGINNKATIAVDIGHNVAYNTGAAYGIYKEDYLTKIVGEKVVSKLRGMGYHVIWTLPKTASSQTDSLKQRTDIAKANNSDIFVSIHFNAGKGNGTEVFYSSEGNAKSMAQNIVNNISSLGFKNRGVKNGEYIQDKQSGLYVLNNTYMPAVLVEGCFIDSSDMDIFIDNGPQIYDKMANAIIDGIMKYLDENKVNKSGWQYIGNTWYFFNENGAAKTGLQYLGEAWYYFDESGAMKTGLQYLGGSWHYFDGNGAMKTGWQYLGETWYYFDENGAAKTGNQYIGETWYFFDENGAMQEDKSGWKQLGATWYYLDKNGVKKTGWQYLGETWYFFDGSGAMKTGWQYLGETWYFFDESGAMKTVGKTGWQYIQGIWYYYDNNQVKKTGWQYLGETWYFFDKNGAMKTGWQYLGETWYFFDGSGAMKTGWQYLGETWYFFHSNGQMAANTVIDGYKIASNGARIK